VKLAVAVCTLVACGGDDGMSTEPDASVDGQGGSDGSRCDVPPLEATWLQQYVTDIATNIPAPRATLTQRNAARTYIQSKLIDLGLTPQTHSYNSGSNIYATLPSTTGGGKTVIVGAHFDTVANSPGANDNASGVAAVLGVARYVADMTCRDHTTTFILFDQEEVGLVGARAYADMLNISTILAVHTVDQVAWDNDGDNRFELESPTPALEAEYRAAAMIVGVPVTKTSTQGTDHEAFRDRGMPAIGLTEEYVGGDTSPYRHTAQDTASTVDAGYLTLGTKLVAQVIMKSLGAP